MKKTKTNGKFEKQTKLTSKNLAKMKLLVRKGNLLIEDVNALTAVLIQIRNKRLAKAKSN